MTNFPDEKRFSALLDTLIDLRRSLHRCPELSNSEQITPEIVVSFLSQCHPHDLLTHIGGSGIAAVYSAQTDGPTLMFRAELDALPIDESSDIPYRSTKKGVAHKCGHDGHMTIVAGLCALLHRRPPQKGRVVLLFQPAEENGQGARQVLADPRFKALNPDYVFALHNLPGKVFGKVYLKSDTITCASIGMTIRIEGRSAHASHPEQGLSPAGAMCDLVRRLPQLAHEPAMQKTFSLVTVVHARLGEEAFGTSPGTAKILATLRSDSDAVLDRLKQKAVEWVDHRTRTEGLRTRIDWTDDFAAGVNHKAAAQLVARAAKAAGQPVAWIKKPFRWSEDFGQFTANVPGALFVLGAGENVSALHSPDYDFPDDLIEPGLTILWQIIDQLLNET
jgi:amidohydrolase